MERWEKRDDQYDWTTTGRWGAKGDDTMDPRRTKRVADAVNRVDVGEVRNVNTLKEGNTLSSF